MRFFKQTRWFEAYLEIEERRILSSFFDHRVTEEGEFECWIGRVYFTIYFYGRRKPVEAVFISPAE